MTTNRRTQSKTVAIEDASPITEAYNSENASEEFAERASGNYEQEGGNHGSDLEHWLAAEAGLLAEQSF